jgi:hypothetical protein
MYYDARKARKLRCITEGLKGTLKGQALAHSGRAGGGGAGVVSLVSL